MDGLHKCWQAVLRHSLHQATKPVIEFRLEPKVRGRGGTVEQTSPSSHLEADAAAA